MLCKQCGNSLEGNPHYCMHCGSPLYSVKQARVQIRPSYRRLWGLLLAFILILMVVAQREPNPADPGTFSTRVNTPDTAAQQTPTNPLAAPAQPASASSPESTLLNYAAAVSSTNQTAAIALWRNPSPKLTRLIGQLHSLHINRLETERETADHADVWMDMLARSHPSQTQHWRGTVELEKVDSRWLITSMKRLHCVEGCSGLTPAASGDSEQFLAEAPLIQRVVSDYYAALNSHDIPRARTYRKNIPKGFDQQVNHIRHAHINQMDDPVIQGIKARVWVDVTLQSSDGGQENWKGAIELERNDHTGWQISSMKSGLAKRS